MVKNLPAVQETWVRSLDLEDPLEKEMTTHSSILAWRIPWTKEPDGLQFMGSQRVGHDWATFTFSGEHELLSPTSSVLRIPERVFQFLNFCTMIISVLFCFSGPFFPNPVWRGLCAVPLSCCNNFLPFLELVVLFVSFPTPSRDPFVGWCT